MSFEQLKEKITVMFKKWTTDTSLKEEFQDPYRKVMSGVREKLIEMTDG